MKNIQGKLKWKKPAMGYGAVALLIFLFCLIVGCILHYVPSDKQIEVADTLALSSWDWIAVIIAFVSLVFSVMTWSSQDKTKENTRRLDAKDYRDMLVSGYYNIVRNAINIYSLAEYMEGRYDDSYPSEEYLEKMKLSLFDTEQISSQNVEKHRYGQLVRLSEAYQYFNIYLATTQKHLSSESLGVDVKRRDMASLKEMHWLVAMEILKTMDYICPEDIAVNRNKIREQLVKSSQYFVSGIKDVPPIDGHPYIGDDVEFLKKIFFMRKGYTEMLDAINTVIAHKLGKAPMDNRSIPLISFRN